MKLEEDEKHCLQCIYYTDNVRNNKDLISGCRGNRENWCLIEMINPKQDRLTIIKNKLYGAENDKKQAINEIIRLKKLLREEIKND